MAKKTASKAAPEAAVAVDSGLLALPAPWKLQGGGQLPQAELAWRSYGRLNPDKSNAILVCHALTGNQNLIDGKGSRDSWWAELVGPGKALDTDLYCVVCCNNLGGCDGSTGPASTDPASGQPYGAAFPRVAVEDWVRAQVQLADSLGIQRWHAVIGGSLGGMQALRWALDHPDRLQRCVAIAAAPFLSAQNIAFNYIARSCIETGGSDGGRGAQGLDGMSLARMIGHITYLSDEGIDSRFGRSSRERDEGEGASDGEGGEGGAQLDFEVESYLHHLARKFTKSGFDPNTYTLMTHALDSFDLGGGAPLAEALAPAQCSFLLVSFDSDWRFPPERSREIVSALLSARKDTVYLNLESDKGHDAFLFPLQPYVEGLRDFLGRGQEAQPPPQGTPAERVVWRQLDTWLEPGQSLLDLGSGEGRLLEHLRGQGQVRGYGVEIDGARVHHSLVRGLHVVQHDLDAGLGMLADQSFDAVLIGNGLHYMKSPAELLREMLRVGRQGLVIFPNHGHWRQRLRFAGSGANSDSDASLQGRRLAQFSIDDFEELCGELGVQILDRKTFGRTPLLSANLGARTVLYRLRAGDGASVGRIRDKSPADGT